MSLLERINTEIIESMKSGDQMRLNTLRMAKTALMNAGIAKDSHELDESEEISVLQKEVKKRLESADVYTTGNRPELAQKEQAEAALLQQYLPAQVSDEEVEAVVTAAIQSSGATSKQDMGKVMGVVMPQLKGKADPSRISAAVLKHLV